MSERGGDFIQPSDLECVYTVGGNLEKKNKNEDRIVDVYNNMRTSRVFERENFRNEQERGMVFDGMVLLASGGEIRSYEDLIDSSRDPNRPNPTKVNETFDILRKAASLTINNDQRLQTSLNIGRLWEILPEGVVKHDRARDSRLNLEERIMEVTITTPEIRGIYREATASIRRHSHLADPAEREKLANEMMIHRRKLLALGSGLSEKGREEQYQSKTYFEMQIGVLTGGYVSSDGSVDREDVRAVMGGESELIRAARMMAEAAEKISASVEGGGREGRRGRQRPVLSLDDNGDEVDYQAVVENRYGKGNEHRNLFEVPWYNFVDSISKYKDPRLYFTPAPEWVNVLSKERQYILDIGTKLARGITTKLAVKDIGYDKARENEVYNLPVKEFRLLYQNEPGFRQGLEKMVQELFVFGEQDGSRFLKIKTDRETLLNKLGNFELYKECLYKRIFLKERYGIDISPVVMGGNGGQRDKTMAETKAEVDYYIKFYVDEFKREHRDRLMLHRQLLNNGYDEESIKKAGGWSDLEAEKQWEYKNNYIYKREFLWRLILRECRCSLSRLILTEI